MWVKFRERARFLDQDKTCADAPIGSQASSARGLFSATITPLAAVVESAFISVAGAAASASSVSASRPRKGYSNGMVGALLGQ